MGVSLTGAKCSQGWVEGDSSKPALFVVGGSANSSSSGYSGLQRYSFLDRTWETITPVVKVTENRQHHGSVFLNDSSSLLIYAGSQDSSTGASTQTFVISTVSPYNVLSFESKNAPPVTDPILLSWNETSALMVGGDTSNLEVFTFDPTGGWQNVGVTLTSGIPDQSTASCALLSLDDGSKVLEVFDMAASPNTVNNTVLLTAGGAVASVGDTVGARKQRRDLTLSNFPSYNGTNAPDSTRQNFSLAQGPNDLVVISGGSDDASLCIFNQSANGWVDASDFFASKQTTITVGGTSTSSVASATAAATSSTGSGGSSNNNSTNHALIILGGVLGAVFGVAALLIIALFVLRWLKKKRQGEHKRRQSSFPQDSKGRRRSTSFSFHEQDQEPFSKAGMPMARGPAQSTDSAAFFKEIAFPSATSQRAYGQGLRKPSISQPIPLQTRSDETVKKSLPSSGIADASSGEVDPSLHPPTKRKTDEGWSTYFQGNNAVDLTDGRSTYASQVTQSDYRGSAWPDFTAPRSPTSTRAQPGLGPHIRQGNVPMGSPSLEHTSVDSRTYGLAVSEGIPGKISSTHSLSSLSDIDVHDEEHEDVDFEKMGDAYSSGIPASIRDDNHWNTLGPNHPSYRPPSSNYTQSIYPPATVYGDSRPASRWPTGENDAQPALPKPITNTQQQKPVRPPRPSQASDQMRDYFGVNTERSRTPSDMSWLNLGNNR